MQVSIFIINAMVHQDNVHSIEVQNHLAVVANL